MSDLLKNGLNSELKKHDYRNKLKSELCKKYEKDGKCPYGNKCDFAHGIGEL